MDTTIQLQLQYKHNSNYNTNPNIDDPNLFKIHQVFFEKIDISLSGG
jgi:hypothetical protein